MAHNNEEQEILAAAKAYGISDKMLQKISNGSLPQRKFLLKELKRELACRIIG